MDVLKEFESKVSTEYIRNHSMQLMKETLTLAEDLSDIADPAGTYEHEIAVLSQYRFVSLALKEYHSILSQYLSKHGITLPDLESLLSEAYQE